MGDAGTVLHHDGTSWMKERVPTKEPLRSVAGDRDATYAVGDRGTVLRREGAGWVEVKGASGNLIAALALGDGELLTLSRDGWVNRSSHGAWSFELLGAGEPVGDVGAFPR